MCQQGSRAAKETRLWLKHSLLPGGEAVVCPDPAPAQRGRSQLLAQSPRLSPGRLHTKHIICEHGDGQHQLPHPEASNAPGNEKPEQKAFARPGQGHGAGHAARAPPPRGRGHRTTHSKTDGRQQVLVQYRNDSCSTGRELRLSQLRGVPRTGHGGKGGAQVAAHTLPGDSGESKTPAQAGQRDRCSD